MQQGDSSNYVILVAARVVQSFSLLLPMSSKIFIQSKLIANDKCYDGQIDLPILLSKYRSRAYFKKVHSKMQNKSTLQNAKKMNFAFCFVDMACFDWLRSIDAPGEEYIVVITPFHNRIL